MDRVCWYDLCATHPMLFNYLLIAIRNIRRHKAYAFINITGLAVGLTAFIYIFLYVQDELSYDRYHDNADRIVRISREWKNQNSETSLHLGAIAPPFLPLIRTQLGEQIEASTRILANFSSLLSVDDLHIQEGGGIFFVEPDFFRVFSIPLIEGDPESVLNGVNSLVLTRSAAKRYFGDEDPIGRTILFNSATPLVVTGIVEDVPPNTHFSFEVLVSFRAVEQQLGETFMTTNFGSNNYYTYVKLKDGVDIREFEAQLPGLIDSQFAAAPTGQLASQFNILHVWPITSIHLHSNLDSEIGTNSDIAYVWIYSIVGLFILAIACINFMNLSTARYGDRMKEIGMRKVMGADRAALIRQFLGESVLFTSIALMISVVLVELGMSSFNEFANKDVGLDLWRDPWLLPGLVLLALVVGVLAGSYPALFLSAFEPQAILKGELTTGKWPLRFRSALVVLQFTISIGLMVSMGIVYSQLEYIQHKELGFEAEHILALPISSDIYSRFDDLQSRWTLEPGIVDVALASRIPSGRLLDSQDAQAEVNGEMVPITFRIADIHVSHEYLSTFGMPIVAGRDFDRNLASDSLQAFILNEMAAEIVGWSSPEEAIGKRFNYGNRSGYVIGIVKDHHFENLRQAISPIVYLITSGRTNSVVFRYAESYQDSVLAYLESEWTYLRPNFPFAPIFVDEAFRSQYESEATLGSLFGLFAGLAVAIAALGLFGLASFSVQRRMKEMSIRKVMGASFKTILMLLNAEFLKLVAISFVIASPVVWVLMGSWLETFAYHTHIRITLFAIAGLGALTIALITVLGQTLKAAAQNPVVSLRQN